MPTETHQARNADVHDAIHMVHGIKQKHSPVPGLFAAAAGENHVNL